MTEREQNLRIKAQEVIDLLKEYLPEYKETFDAYNPDGEYDLKICKEGEEWICGEFYFILEDLNKEYVLDIGYSGIDKVTQEGFVEIANYLNREISKQRTFENPWTWDDAIIEIKRQMEER